MCSCTGSWPYIAKQCSHFYRAKQCHAACKHVKKPYKNLRTTGLTYRVFSLEYSVVKESSALSSTAHSQRELQILHLLWPALVEQRVTWTIWGGGKKKSSGILPLHYMGCSASLLRLYKNDPLDTIDYSDSKILQMLTTLCGFSVISRVNYTFS